jgi:hypothetical protein
LSTLYQRLERIKAEHPKLSEAIDALATYIERLLVRGQSEVEPYLASQTLHMTEAFVLGLLGLFEEVGLVKHSYNIYCGKQRTFLANVPEKEDIPSVLYCNFCDKEHHDPDDFEVELAFRVEDQYWKSMSHNAAAG